MVDQASIHLHDANPIATQHFIESVQIKGAAGLLSVRQGRTFNLAWNAHHLINAALLAFAFNATIGIALACYGLTIGLVSFAVHVTHDRNLHYESSW